MDSSLVLSCILCYRKENYLAHIVCFLGEKLVQFHALIFVVSSHFKHYCEYEIKNKIRFSI